MPQKNWSALAIIVIIAAIPFAGPVARGDVFRFRDHLHYFEPMRMFTATQLATGQLPYWNPYNASGEPWLANPQTCVFYPPAWLFLVLPFAAAYMLFLLLHLVILGGGAFLLFRRFASWGGALAGGVALMCSGPVLSFIDVTDNLASFAWTPLAIWAGLRLPGHRRHAIAAVILALSFLAGQPFFAMLAALLFVASRISGGVGWLRDVTITGVGAFALSAIQLLPFAAIIVGTDRAGAFAERRILRESIPPSDWLRLFTFPRLAGNGTDASLHQTFVPMTYLGVPVVLLAVAAFFAWRDRRRVIVAASALAALALIFAAGGNLFTGRLFVVLPVTVTRYPSRLVALVAIAAAALAAIGWDRIRPKRAWVDLVVTALVAADLLTRGAPLLTTVPFRPDVIPYPREVGRDSKLFRLPTLAPTITDREAWFFAYINLFGPRFDSGSGAPLVQTRYSRVFETAFRDVRPDLMRFLSAGDVLSDRELPLPRVAQVRRVAAYHDAGALPFATVWTSAVAAPRDAAIDKLVTSGVTPQLLVSPATRVDLTRGATIVRRADVTALDTQRMSVRVETGSPAVVMVTQQDAPGWRVFVDGTEQPGLLAAGIFRAVEVGPGRHEVEWRYRPAGFAAGAALSLLAVAWVAWEWLRSRSVQLTAE